MGSPVDGLAWSAVSLGRKLAKNDSCGDSCGALVPEDGWPVPVGVDCTCLMNNRNPPSSVGVPCCCCCCCCCDEDANDGGDVGPGVATAAALPLIIVVVVVVVAVGLDIPSWVCAGKFGGRGGVGWLRLVAWLVVSDDDDGGVGRETMVDIAGVFGTVVGSGATVAALLRRIRGLGVVLRRPELLPECGVLRRPDCGRLSCWRRCCC